MEQSHSFHVPVMGTAFSIDTPLKIAKYGISSVISLVDDRLIEDVRKFYSEKYCEDYIPITDDQEDYRARRITAYLNLVDKLVKKQVAGIKEADFVPGSEILKYFELLPENAPAKRLFRIMLATKDENTKKDLQEELRGQIRAGDINVNIMTKVDRVNYAKDKQPLPAEYSDALSALRGFAKSTLNAAVVFSAGFNRRLYSYIENFKDFYADASGFIKKRIILKVSDFRSTITQGKFLAKKGLWVHEFRIESGLNCGGHAFASEGNLMGPILEEFKNRKQELLGTLHKICTEALKLKNKFTFAKALPVRITAQGGIGTAQEDLFLKEYYEVDGTGWATPFLLVPEVTNVDEWTLKKLSEAKEEDLYLSDISPLGVPFNNLRDNASDAEKERKIGMNRPGSSCPKGYLVSNTEFTPQPICTASRLYQKLKIDKLKSSGLSAEDYTSRLEEVTQKACLCNDLGEVMYLKHGIKKKFRNLFPAICPGPNMAYFSKIAILGEMVGHIYGRINILNGSYRPHMFIKELKMYIDYFHKEIRLSLPSCDRKRREYLHNFKNNLGEGIKYYRELFSIVRGTKHRLNDSFLSDLENLRRELDNLIEGYRGLFGDTSLKANHPSVI